MKPSLFFTSGRGLNRQVLEDLFTECADRGTPVHDGEASIFTESADSADSILRRWGQWLS